jgi:hypothetical protein
MTNHTTSLTLKLVAGAAVVGVALLLRGLAPGLYRYLRMRRM